MSLAEYITDPIPRPATVTRQRPPPGRPHYPRRGLQRDDTETPRCLRTPLPLITAAPTFRKRCGTYLLDPTTQVSTHYTPLASRQNGMHGISPPPLSLEAGTDR
ncbi:unnamed protein product [Nezara viridula]|uniref:Uncharacterized protein n=1 Tax=Nezara viridula TaxID=85310 RepID=A0A9P0MMR7_NEZVI|nr:unnamed protein product [Nezara viridula]